VVPPSPAPHCGRGDSELFAQGAGRRIISSIGSKTLRRTTCEAGISRTRPEQLRIEVDLVAEMSVINPFDFFLTPYGTISLQIRHRTSAANLVLYLVKSPATPLVAGYLAGIPVNAAAPSISCGASISVSPDIRI